MADKACESFATESRGSGFLAPTPAGSTESKCAYFRSYDFLVAYLLTLTSGTKARDVSEVSLPMAE